MKKRKGLRKIVIGKGPQGDTQGLTNRRKGRSVWNEGNATIGHRGNLGKERLYGYRSGLCFSSFAVER